MKISDKQIIFIFSNKILSQFTKSVNDPVTTGRMKKNHWELVILQLFYFFSCRFSLDEETGWVILRASLDYELMRRFTLTVLARDGGGEETTGRIRVNVLDVNDNAPLFQKEAYVGSLRENEQAVQPVARVRVCTRCLVAGLQRGN